MVVYKYLLFSVTAAIIVSFVLLTFPLALQGKATEHIWFRTCPDAAWDHAGYEPPSQLFPYGPRYCQNEYPYNDKYAWGKYYTEPASWGPYRNLRHVVYSGCVECAGSHEEDFGVSIQHIKTYVDGAKVSGNQAIQYYNDGDNYSWRTDFQILDQDTVFESGDKITTWIETDPGGSGFPFQDHSAVIAEF